MSWRALQRKQVGEAVAHLLAGSDQSAAIVVRRRTVDGRVWQGTAVFPPAEPQSLQHAQALQRFDDLQAEGDVEDLIREWGDPEGVELLEFIEVEADVFDAAEGLEGADDLPDLVVPDDLVRKAKRIERKTKRATKIPPSYSRRDYPKPKDTKPNKAERLPFDQYDNIIVSFSGGKDSIACALLLLEMGVPPERIELWHQAVDGKPGRDERFWDWPCTEGYCEAFAKAFGMKLLFQWKDGGYLGELTRRDARTNTTTFQLLDGGEMTAPQAAREVKGTRLAFPAMASDLKTRWCSAYVKIDVAKKVFTNDPRFEGTRTLVLTGERRQESTHRATYEDVTNYTAPTKQRIVHQWRAVLGWFEQDVWEIIERFRVRPHPAYQLGWSRVSCLPCIFGNANQWASVQDIAPELLTRMGKLEDKFYVASQKLPGHPWSEANQDRRHAAKVADERAMYTRAVPLFLARKSDPAVLSVLEDFAKDQQLGTEPTEKTIKRFREAWQKAGSYVAPKFKLKVFDGYLRVGESLSEAAARGQSYITPEVRPHVKLAMSEHYNLDVILGADEPWGTPAGAYKHSGGPT
jgi:3'-phosphoadenosine 5'-phosphosulfate sulfotransferase (PAPS reductase)/FAD synthetase